MTTSKLRPGCEFPTLTVYDHAAEPVDISKPTGDADWQMVVVFRGSHCPKCTEFLNKLAGFRKRLLDVGIDIAAVSADRREQMDGYLSQLEVNFPFYCGLTIEQAQDLGLYVSEPAPWKDSDHDFPEPGLFVINSDGLLQIADISNSPFARPDLEVLVSGLEWMRNPKINYPIRGTRYFG